MEIMKGKILLVTSMMCLQMYVFLVVSKLFSACSKVICQATGKPESYIAVSITDNASVIFGGSDAPTALGNLYSVCIIIIMGIKSFVHFFINKLFLNDLSSLIILFFLFFLNVRLEQLQWNPTGKLLPTSPIFLSLLGLQRIVFILTSLICLVQM